ncbi:DNA protecting protein DprA [Arthrobacter sp. MWB30]|nr:DNA protecting protein DprA [Arthrobacter sp. MWB30]
MNERIARAALTRLFEPQDKVGHALLAQLGAEELLDGLTTSRTLPRPAGITAEEFATAHQGWSPKLPDLEPRKDLDDIAQLGGGFLIPGDQLWPAALNDLTGSQAVIGLWYRGNLADGVPAGNKLVAITGSRDCTSYGASVTGDMAFGLAREGFCVVSGLGYGIDTHAHRSALAGWNDRGVQATIAVMGGGLDRDHPSGNVDLAESVRANGFALSELPPGSAPTRQRFLARNRIIAALAGVTVIVEARQRSAALNTAAMARTLDRTVGAVPGSVFSSTSAGCHQLIQDGQATLVTDTRSVAKMLFEVKA